MYSIKNSGKHFICKISTLVEEIIGKYQGGFQRERSIFDQIFTMRQIL
jgi:hypothetical protein